VPRGPALHLAGPSRFLLLLAVSSLAGCGGGLATVGTRALVALLEAPRSDPAAGCHVAREDLGDVQLAKPWRECVRAWIAAGAEP
jgi:hypothetical protein